MWTHREHMELHETFSIDAALGARGCEETALPAAERARRYATYLADAREWSERLGEPPHAANGAESEQFGELSFFNVG
jgi:hypothetical protein